MSFIRNGLGRVTSRDFATKTRGVPSTSLRSRCSTRRGSGKCSLQQEVEHSAHIAMSPALGERHRQVPCRGSVLMIHRWLQEITVP